MHPTSEFWILLGQIGVALSVITAVYRAVRYSARRLDAWMESMERSRAEQEQKMRDAMLNELRGARKDIQDVADRMTEVAEAVNGHPSE